MKISISKWQELHGRKIGEYLINVFDNTMAIHRGGKYAMSIALNILSKGTILNALKLLGIEVTVKTPIILTNSDRVMLTWFKENPRLVSVIKYEKRGCVYVIYDTDTTVKIPLTSTNLLELELGKPYEIDMLRTLKHSDVEEYPCEWEE
jgi:hypothetical protein